MLNGQIKYEVEEHWGPQIPKSFAKNILTFLDSIKISDFTNIFSKPYPTLMNLSFQT